MPMHAYVLLRTSPREIESITAALAERAGFIGLEELPTREATRFEVDNEFRFLEPNSPAAHDFAAWLAADGYRFSTLVEGVVTSPQFRYKRGGDGPSQE